MPVIHAPLNDEDFVDLAIMAREKGMTRSALASYILIAAIRKSAKVTVEDATVELNRKALKTITKEGVPIIPMYERQ